MNIKKKKTRKTTTKKPKKAAVKSSSAKKKPVVAANNKESTKKRTKKKKPDVTSPNTRETPEIKTNRKSTSQTAASKSSVRSEAAMLLPLTDAEKKILQQRAESLARKTNVEIVEGESRQEYVRIRLGSSEHYGIAYPYMDEIIDVTAITPVPCTPSFFAGVINHKGELLNVLDITSFFHTDKATDSDEGKARILVVHAGGLQVGILVDDVIGSDNYLSGQLTSPLSSDGVSNLDYVKGIHDGKVTLLDLDAMLSDPAVLVNDSDA